MTLKNPLQMNDWPIKHFLLLIFYFQLLWLLLIGLDLLDFHLPLLQPLVSFIFLSFLPGYLLLRILRMHQLGSATSLLYAAGLSIASLMLIGLFLSVISPLFGINTPISLIPLTVTITLFTLFLAVLAYLRDRDFQAPEALHLDELLSPALLFLFLVPFLAIFGTYLLNLYGNNTLQMILLLVLAIFPLLTLKWVQKKYYPLVLLVLSLSVLLHTTLVSPYVWGADLNAELIIANYVLKNSLWHYSVAGDYNAMLSIVLLAPMYSILSQLSLVWTFKIIYPALFSLVPLGLYLVYRRVTDNQKTAFLAGVFFITVNSFFNTLAATARQEVAEIFLVLILLLVVQEKVKDSTTRLLLMAVFAFSLVVSHYGVTWIFLLIIALSFPILLILHRFPDRYRLREVQFQKYRILNYVFPLFLLVLALAWSILVSNYSIFQNITDIGVSILTSLTDLLNQQTSQGLFYLKGDLSFFQSIERFLYIICNFFIAIGILNLIFGSDKKFHTEYKALSIASFLVLALGIVLPYFSSALNTDRLFHINIIILSPFLVTGFLTTLRILNRIPIFKNHKFSSRNCFYLVATFLLVFSIFNTAFIYQIFDQPKTGRFALDTGQDFFWVNNQEIKGMEWLDSSGDPQVVILADVYKSISLENILYLNRTPPNFVFQPSTGGYSVAYGTDPAQQQYFQSLELLRDSYVFLGTFNIKHNLLYVHKKGSPYIENPDLQDQINKIYDNGGSWVLKGTGG